MKIWEKLDWEAVQSYARAKCVSAECLVPILQPEALMIGILLTTPQTVTKVFGAAIPPADRLIQEYKDALESRPRTGGNWSPLNLLIGCSEEVKTVLKVADRGRQKTGEKRIGVRHLLLALSQTCPSVKAILFNQRFGQAGPSVAAGSAAESPSQASGGQQVPVKIPHPPRYHVMNGDACWCWRNRFGPRDSSSRETS